jgi:two-component system sensor histidine kinase TctE
VRQRCARGGRGQAPGMGLGLPIVEEIAGLFGGHLNLGEGPEGKGLKASVTFPAAISA